MNIPAEHHLVCQLLFLLNEPFDTTSVILAAVAGSFLGIVVIIPLRKQMIELERLRFPSGIAVAALLKSPGAGARLRRP